MKSSTGFGFSFSLLFFFIVAVSINVVYSEDAASIVVDSEDATSIVVNSEIARTCSYMLIVQTGNVVEAGTDSRISVTLVNEAGQRIEIPDLKEWGDMRPGHDYFERGNEDVFRVTSSVCFIGAAPVCSITVTSDGSGQKPGWFLGVVEVRQLPIHNYFKFNFNFGRWLAKDEPPYELTASINRCEV